MKTIKKRRNKIKKLLESFRASEKKSLFLATPIHQTQWTRRPPSQVYRTRPQPSTNRHFALISLLSQRKNFWSSKAINVMQSSQSSPNMRLTVCFLRLKQLSTSASNRCSSMPKPKLMPKRAETNPVRTKQEGSTVRLAKQWYSSTRWVTMLRFTQPQNTPQTSKKRL